jgi:hypothetical protein
MPIPGQLIEFLDRTPLPWLRYDHTKRKLIVIADNHLLSTYRSCPQHFLFYALEGWKRKGSVRVDETERNWFLDFGILIHKQLEYYYLHFRDTDFDVVHWATSMTLAAWETQRMDIHAEHKEYKTIGGVHGLIALLMQYATVMSPQNELLRVLGTEVAFGSNLEVPLLSAQEENPDYEFYLAGRMDMIMDDGYFICPMDHKTMGRFTGDPGLRFINDEGPTGYIFALKTVLPQFLGEDQILKRDCNRIIMNLICKTPQANPIERFRRVHLRKTTEQLEAYRRRMVTTCGRLLADVTSYAEGWSVPRNTSMCQNWMHLTCSYFDVCRQQSREAELITLSNGFIKAPLWNTEEV